MKQSTALRVQCAILIFLAGFSLYASSKNVHASQAQEQQTFAAPNEAVEAVLQACQKNDIDTLLKIFGPDGRDIVESGDTSDDRDRRALFVQLVHKKMNLIRDPANPDKIIVSIGEEDWPFPVPLVREKDRWRFDSSQGRREILARRIGSNELAAIDVCRGYVEAQYEYANRHSEKGVPVYAQKIASSPGKQDGLYWEARPGEPASDIPRAFARAAAELVEGSTEPYHGYFFKVLTAQGPDARGGAVHYTVNGSMIGGFAMVAWPAKYGVSGIQTFIVNHDGVVYENNLGPESGKIAAEMTAFNPDKSWRSLQSP